MYILNLMIYNDKKINDIFSYWLLVSLILVFTTIVIGGLTRLTNSGLSIIEWELFKGIIPPLNESDWEQYFASYKTIPQYKLLNTQMNLSEFTLTSKPSSYTIVQVPLLPFASVAMFGSLKVIL
mgnify:CR=1 FL=1